MVDIIKCKDCKRCRLVNNYKNNLLYECALNKKSFDYDSVEARVNKKCYKDKGV